MDWPTMEKLIAFELDHVAKTAAAEKCCTVEIPSLAPKKD